MDMFMFMNDDDDDVRPRASPAAAAGTAARNNKKKTKEPGGKSAAAKEKKRSTAAKQRPFKKRAGKSPVQAAKPPAQAAKSAAQAAKRPAKAAHLAKSPVPTRRCGGLHNAISYGSDCSGMGTDSVAMRRIFGVSNARHVFASDVEASARRVIRGNYPPERMYKNMQGRKQLRRGEVDVYTAGLPCSLTCQICA
jgi:hypothetical protein